MVLEQLTKDNKKSQRVKKMIKRLGITLLVPFTWYMLGIIGWVACRIFADSPIVLSLMWHDWKIFAFAIVGVLIIGVGIFGLFIIALILYTPFWIIKGGKFDIFGVIEDKK